MKHGFITSIVFITLISVTVTIPATAQWKYLQTSGYTLAFGVHDTNFFHSFSSPNVVQRYAPWDSHLWTSILSQSVTSFASLGRYFYANNYRSSDNGQSWKALGGVPFAQSEYYLLTSSPTSVYRSGDSGDSWQGVVCPGAIRFGANGTCVLALTNAGLYRSLDTGLNWTPVSTILKHIAQIVSLGTMFFAVDSSGHVSISSDSGSNWKPMTVDSVGTSEYVTCLATDGRNLFAGTREGVFLSRDSGQTWKAMNDSLNYKNVQILGVFDTLLFANDVGGITGYELYSRSIPEMTNDTTKSGVKTISNNDTIEVYPNPANGIVTILSGGTSILGVSVLNLLGEQVLTIPNSYASEINLDISKLASGTYFLQIETSNGSVLRKIVKEQ